MTHDGFDGALERLLSRPFTPFVIELHGGTRMEVDCGTPIYFDHDGVVRIIDAPVPPGSITTA